MTSPKEATIVGNDMFWTRKQDPFVTDDVRRLGRLEAQVETLQLKWKMYRDEVNKLVNRLEKRDERQAAKERRQVEEQEEIAEIAVDEPVDEITARVLARRNHHAVPGQPPG